jgi:glycosyltransferase involved in cell wall biosynthesis
MRYYIIIPAHNEAALIAHTLESVIKQSLLPTKLVVVNDNSTDETGNIVNSFAKSNDFITQVELNSSDAHIPGAKVINAFNAGKRVLPDDFEFLVKLDADCILPNNYFERIAEIFKKDSKVGMAGGFAYEQNEQGEWLLNHPMNKDHIRGAFKAYTRSCFQAIGGLRSAMGWDTVDELLAQYHGFKIITNPDLQVKHLRPVGKAYQKKSGILQGKAMHSMRYGMLLTLIASVKMAWKQGRLAVIRDNIKGYFEAKKISLPFLVNEKEGLFIRKLRWKNIRRKLL